ncbi:F-type conjugal transfer protein TraK [Superficieibacter sp. 1612_C1]|uniref:F-type conjugal transfer protein TraK n=1 Tax=Superficieibacter sp. 1612_C1 TaxID=2780382 RepID=UPI001D167967|nr:F-type conjugal transfer protein TraK [Superficieibacter sp. 1612_C1]
MKFRISPVAAAVFLAAGFFTSGLWAAPAAIPFENDAAFNVTLSNTNPSKVVVDGELITSISGPSGAYDQSTTDNGALILSPLVGQNFTLFIQTDRGSALSLNVRPQPGSGKTLRFTPMSPPLRRNDDAKAWEEGQTYEKTLVALSRTVVNGQVPDDYQEYPVSRMPAYTPASDIRLTPERQFVGNHLRIVRFRMSNPGNITRSLRERDFWRRGVITFVSQVNAMSQTAQVTAALTRLWQNWPGWPRQQKMRGVTQWMSGRLPARR